MKKLKMMMVVSVCVLGLLSVGAQATPVTVGYVFNTLDGSGEWIDAGSDPDWSTKSYEYDNIDSRWWINYNLGGGYVLYKFEAPAGKLIDKVELGLYGWTYNTAHWIKCTINGTESAYISKSAGDYHEDASLTLASPVQVVEVKLEGGNNWDPGDPDLTRIYHTEQSSGNTHQFAAHVVPEPATIGLMLVGLVGLLRRKK